MAARPKRSARPPATAGICHLVGAGPGDPGLATLRARECIERADVLVYDYLVNPRMLDWARPGAEILYVGKEAGQHTLPQEDINGLLVERARRGLRVVRLKGGDPFVFGRGGEEAEELAAAGIPFEIVPGISSAIAGPAYAGIPVTHRDHNTVLTIFTGHEDPTKEASSLDFAKLAAADGTKVMLMGVGRIGELAGRLVAHGAAPATPVALVRWATTPRQETLCGTLADIAERVAATDFKAPAVCVIGGVVGLRESLRWFDRRPLTGRRIIVTRTRSQAGALSRELADLGADVFELPVIRIEPPEDLRGFAEMVKDAHRYQWIVFTSPNGVDAFFEWFFKLYQDVRSIGGARIAAIGPGTAQRIRDHHLAVDLMPDNHVAEGLVEAFRKEAESLENEMILWVRGAGAREVVATELGRMGAIVDEAIAYRTVPEQADVAGGQKRLREEGADLITFTSSSTVEHFFALCLPLPAAVQFASIGPVTSAALRASGHPVHLEAASHDIPGLVEAIRRHYT
jgi:uroporphyrinogen III methyltransferase / synthase